MNNKLEEIKVLTNKQDICWANIALLEDTANNYATAIKKLKCELAEDYLLEIFKTYSGIITIYGIVNQNIKLTFENVQLPKYLQLYFCEDIFNDDYYIQ